MRIAALLLLSLYWSPIASAQEQPVTYNEEQGYYIVRYPSTIDGSTQKAILIPGNEVEPEVHVKVASDTSTGEYRYMYRLSNGSKAKHLLHSFSVEVYAPLENPARPNREWRMDIHHVLPAFNWAKTRGELQGLMAQEEVTGFAFSSSGLPGIVNSYASSADLLVVRGASNPTGEVEAIVDSIRTATQHIVLRTVGPKNTPDVLNYTELPDTIRAYIDESLELGWIANRGILQSLQAKLDEAERQLERGNTPTALNALRAFVNEVEALPEQQLSSEAYALLKYNTEYLIEQLGAQ